MDLQQRQLRWTCPSKTGYERGNEMPLIWSLSILTMLGGINKPGTIGAGLRLDTHPPNPPHQPPPQPPSPSRQVGTRQSCHTLLSDATNNAYTCNAGPSDKNNMK